MKTVKGLHEKMGTFENANTSFHQAARCKRYTNEVLAFSMVKEEELLRATEEIQNLTIPLREIVIVFFICNEALSILENAAEFINIPQQLKDVLLQLRDKNAAKAEEKEESEE